MDPVRREFLRRLVHVGLVAFAFLLPFCPWRLIVGAAGFATLFNALVLPRVAVVSLLDRPDRRGRNGLVLYPLSILVLALVFRPHVELVQVGWIALAVGDGIAPYLGRVFPEPRWPWHPRKSVAASAAAQLVAAALMLVVVPAPAALAAAAAGTAADGLSRWVDDNLGVPLLAALGAAFVLGVDH